MNHSQVTVTPSEPVSAPTSATAGGSSVGDRLRKPTLASTWEAVAGSPIGDELLEWPPDVFALTDVILDRAEAYRFVLSPPEGVLWPPGGDASWSDAVGQAARRWSAWAEDRDGAFPELVAEKWGVFRERAGIPLEELAAGRDWRVCEALLTLHAIADEACAGVFVALDRSDGEGCIYRARGRELLARVGCLARLHSHFVRVLPKIRTPPTGGASFSRYACVYRPGLETRWHKLPARHRGTDPQAEHAHLLLLPWPLRVRESDFRAVEGSVQRLAKEPFGFFEFAPEERLDLDLVDRMLIAARDEVGRVDVVLLPESAVEESELDALEAVLARHGVVYLQAGIRKRSPRPGGLGSNQMHIGVNSRLRKGWARPGFTLWTVVSRPPGQASPMVARRKPDLPVPPRWRASPSHPLVGGDRHPSPVSPDRGSRRRHHDRVVGVRRPRAERRRGGGHPVDRPDPRFDCSTRRAAAHIPLAGAVRERAGRRPWLGRS